MTMDKENKRMIRKLGWRVVWFIAAYLCIRIAEVCWYEVVTEGFTGVRIVEAVAKTTLAGYVAISFTVSRGWREDDDDL